MSVVCAVVGHRWFWTEWNLFNIALDRVKTCSRCGRERTVPASLKARTHQAIFDMNRAFADLERRLLP